MKTLKWTYSNIKLKLCFVISLLLYFSFLLFVSHALFVSVSVSSVSIDCISLNFVAVIIVVFYLIRADSQCYLYAFERKACHKTWNFIYLKWMEYFRNWTLDFNCFGLQFYFSHLLNIISTIDIKSRIACILYTINKEHWKQYSFACFGCVLMRNLFYW